jgi:demethylmenaquinone methyltransferase/2-methoxy-6-polyprenyl-1,4-benzoquinol methylase
MDVEKAYDAVAKDYDSYYIRAIDLVENELVFRLLRDWDGMLDLGCGTGLLLDYLHPKSYVGLDISQGMLAQARQKWPGHFFVHGDMAAIPYEAHRFDSVVCMFGSFCHCAFPEDVILEMNRVLKPRGRLCVMLEGPRSLDRPLHIVDGSMLTFWRPWEAKMMFEAFGFTVSVRGLNALGDILNGVLPKPFLKTYVWFESWTLGKWWPELCYFLVVMGRKQHD